MAQARVQYLSEAEKAFIHEKTMQVLETVGVAYNTPLAIDLLAEAGAQVDRERLTARFGWELVERCLATVPREILLAGRDPSRDRVLGRDQLVATSDGMFTYVHDDLTGEKREGTLADLARFTHLVDALDEIDTHWPSPQTSDVEAHMTAARDAGDLPAQHEQAHPGRDPRARARRADPRHVRGGERRVAAGAAGLLGHELHHRAACSTTAR